MGANIPVSVATSTLSEELILAGLLRIHQGKVRDTFKIPDYPELLLQVATDRISIFDFVLPATVQDKGKILTAMTVFWLTGPLKTFMNHLVAFGTGINEYLPASLKGNSDLQSRALIVKKLEIVPVECIIRGYLTGSGWASYQKDKTVCGIKLPEGLRNGDQLPVPIFTPTTKAETGHDEHLDAQQVVDIYGAHLKNSSLDIYNAASEYADSQGIIIADFKLEFGDDGTLGDEVVTPDSSRFWHKEEWATALEEGGTPTSQDKQFVRDWGTGIKKLNPADPDHLKFVEEIEVPNDVLTETAVRYREIFQQLVGINLRDFQLKKMGIKG